MDDLVSSRSHLSCLQSNKENLNEAKRRKTNILIEYVIIVKELRIITGLMHSYRMISCSIHQYLISYPTMDVYVQADRAPSAEHFVPICQGTICRLYVVW